MLNLIFTLIFLFTLKIVIEKNLYSSSIEAKINSLVLGKYINFLIKKVISTWSTTYNYWIFFILIFLVIFMICTIGVTFTLITVSKE